MVRAGLVAAMLFCGAAQAAERIPLAVWAAGLPKHFVAHGVKTEPTYEEVVDISRDGDVFSATGGAPGWAERLTESVEVGATGEVSRRPCAANADCREARPPSGFLATAALVAAARRGALAGTGGVEAFGPWRVICVDAVELGYADPILDPCFEIRTGAAIAQRHRRNGRFDGPTLDRNSLRLE
jgi:hypothetical protein